VTSVLVIDDEAPIRLLCRVNLEAEGMKVFEAADGPTGLEQARENTPDVVLLDVMMPGLDGWRVVEALFRSRNPRFFFNVARFPALFCGFGGGPLPFGFLDFETPSLCGLLLVLLFLIPDLFAACLDACLDFTVDVREGAIVPDCVVR